MTFDAPGPSDVMTAISYICGVTRGESEPGKDTLLINIELPIGVLLLIIALDSQRLGSILSPQK